MTELRRFGSIALYPNIATRRYSIIVREMLSYLQLHQVGTCKGNPREVVYRVHIIWLAWH